MDDRRSVRAELERKKILLAQMREERERRSRLLNGDDQNQPNSSLNRDIPDDADGVLRMLGISSTISRASTVPSNVSSLDQSQRLSTATLNDSHASVSGQQSLHDKLSSSLTDNQLLQGLSSNHRSNVPLQVVQVNQINIQPKERVSYAKSTQTPAPPPTPPEDDQVEAQPDAPKQSANNQSRQANQSTSTSLNSSPLSTVQHIALEWDNEFEAWSKEQQLENLEIREMKEEQRKQIEMREDYQQFIDRATKILERALYHDESSEIFIHYFPDNGKDSINDDKRNGNGLSLNRIFFDERWSRNRCVTSLDWSAQYPELLATSYYNNEQTPSDPDGTLLVWNMKFKNTLPEYRFHCQSSVMSCCYAKFHPSLIVGGTYSGQIVLWDMRNNKRTPVQRSSLTAAAHTHPVYCAKVVGTQNAHNLISISTDGKLCSWSLDMLSAPQEVIELDQQKQTRFVAVTCMSFHPEDSNNFLVGSEEGTVYSACRHGSKTGILSSFESHQGLVTNVDFRPMDTQPGYSHLFLTSSIDWTVKLWDTKEPEPIHTFESNGDYIYDVKWSPNNPAMFATADGDGRVDIWNLANDSELPTASTCVEPIGSNDTKIQPSLNKLIWTPNGNQVVVGDDVGRIHVYDIGDVGDIGSSRRQVNGSINTALRRLY